MEREHIVSRVKSGLKRARSQGKTLGRPSGIALTNTKLLKKYRSLATDLHAGISTRKCAAYTRCEFEYSAEGEDGG